MRKHFGEEFVGWVELVVGREEEALLGGRRLLFEVQTVAVLVPQSDELCEVRGRELAARAAHDLTPNDRNTICVSFSTRNYGTFRVRFGLLDSSTDSSTLSRGSPEHSPSYPRPTPVSTTLKHQT